MMRKILNKGLILLFMLSLIVPGIMFNRKDGAVSASENRKLASRAHLRLEDGTLNRNFLTDFENWYNDNIGFRSPMVIANALMQYRLFHRISNNTDVLLGPEGEFNYATEAIIKDYQHFNLKSEETCEKIRESYQYLNDWLEGQGIQYYYMQCWDKQSIYPEQFPRTIISYGDISKTDQIMEALGKTSVTVINPREDLIREKANCQTYSRFGDPTHWTRRGAYIGYLALMRALNERNEGMFRVLKEEDYDLSLTDQGNTYFDAIHEEEMLEEFRILSPKAERTDEKLSFLSEDQRHSFYTNPEAGNRIRVMVLGDSYLDSFLMDDLAESFYELFMIRGNHTEELPEILEAYHPDIIINENAERTDRTKTVIALVKKLKEESREK